MYFSSLFPYVVLICFLVRALLLKGSFDGIRHMFTPKVRAEIPAGDDCCTRDGGDLKFSLCFVNKAALKITRAAIGWLLVSNLPMGPQAVISSMETGVTEALCKLARLSRESCHPSHDFKRRRRKSKKNTTSRLLTLTSEQAGCHLSFGPGHAEQNQTLNVMQATVEVLQRRSPDEDWRKNNK